MCKPFTFPGTTVHVRRNTQTPRLCGHSCTWADERRPRSGSLAPAAPVIRFRASSTTSPGKFAVVACTRIMALPPWSGPDGSGPAGRNERRASRGPARTMASRGPEQLLQLASCLLLGLDWSDVVLCIRSLECVPPLMVATKIEPDTVACRHANPDHTTVETALVVDRTLSLDVDSHDLA